jgi:hypothetical protein
MEGSCSECGYAFAWFDIFYPQVNDQRGFVEHGRGVRAFLARAFRTWLWALVPNWFWHRVALRHRIDVRRMLLWALAVPLALCVVSVAAMMGLLLLENQYGARNGLPMFASMITWPVALFDDGRGGWAARLTVGELVGVGIAATLLPFHLTWILMLVILSESRRQAKIRTGHLLRGVVYGLAWFMLPLVLRLGSVLWDAGELLADAVDGSRPVWGLTYIRYHLYVPYESELQPFSSIWVVGGFVWLTWWWWSAIIQGWRFHQGWLVCLLLTIVAALVTVLASITPLLLA